MKITAVGEGLQIRSKIHSFQSFAISFNDCPLFPDFVVHRKLNSWRSNRFSIQTEKYGPTRV